MPDHTVTVADSIPGDFDPLWMARGQFLLDERRHATSNLMRAAWASRSRTGDARALQQDCFRIKDHEGIEYVVHRTE